MKAESLFHLLQIRARKLEEGADADQQRQLHAVQAELRVSHSRGWFEVSWRHDGRDFSLNVPEHDFTFYVAGDTGKAVEQRGTTGSVRQRNWEASAALWQRLAEVSGFQIPRSSADSEMGLAPQGRPALVSRNRQILVGTLVALAGTFASGLFVDWTLALSAGPLALLLTLLMPAFDDTQMHRPFSLAEVVIVSGAVFPPLLAGADTLWLLPVAAGLVLTTWTEAVETDLPAAWGLGGLLVGLATFALGIGGLLPGLLLCGGLAALRLLLPRRLAHAHAAWCAVGTLAGLLLERFPAW